MTANAGSHQNEAHMGQITHYWGAGDKKCHKGRCWIGCAARSWCWMGQNCSTDGDCGEKVYEYYNSWCETGTKCGHGF